MAFGTETSDLVGVDLAIGTVDEIADRLLAPRARLGIRYFTVRTLGFAVVISRIRMRDAA